MKNFRYALLSVVVLAGVQACTWVKSSDSGNAVHVAYDGNVSGCRDAGSVSVSVADKVAFYHRPALKVRDELETLARNQAASLPADTIKATSEPTDGAQTFEAYVCGGMRMHRAAETPPTNTSGVQTYPIKDH
jgi:hypothetical protein